MFSSNSYKVLFLVFFALMLTASCNFWQSNSEKNKVQNPGSDIQTNIPFSTKEPEIFQAEIEVVTIYKEKKRERTFYVAKKRERLLTTFGVKNTKSFSHLITEEAEYKIEHDSKTYEKIDLIADLAATLPNRWREFLTTKLLNEKTNAKFEKIGTENNLTKYRVILDTSKNSEALIYTAPNIPFPVKQEFYSILDGEKVLPSSSEGKKVLTTSVEVKNFKTEVDDKLFELPKDYKEIN